MSVREGEAAGGPTIVVLVCFFLSGVTALIYEVLWTRMIVTVIGGAPFAVSAILTVTMAGLGLGSHLAGRWADRISPPSGLVRLYGLLEIAIGVSCLLLPHLLGALRPLCSVLYNSLFGHFLAYNALTFLVCAALLIVPAVCMGATLPLLSRFSVSRLSHLGGHVGGLYGLNTLGAALGALVCGFWLIELLGVRGTLALAVAANVAIGLACVAASRSLEAGRPAGPPGAVAEPDTVAAPLPAKAGTAALVVFAVSGFCSMAYEVIWTRLLGLIIGPTTYSLTIVLVTFITGLALGSVVFGRLADRTARPFHLLVLLQLVAGLSAIVVSHFLGNSQFFYAKLIDRLQDRFFLLHLAKAGTLFLFMLPPTICLGAAFPLAGRIVTRSLASVGSSIGRAYAINTVGAVLGAFSAGFLLIPLVGKEAALRLLTLLQAGASLAAGLAVLPLVRGGRRLAAPAVALGAAVMAASLFFPSWNRETLSRGRYHRTDTLGPRLQETGWVRALLKGPEILEGVRDEEVVYYGDGIGGFTTVVRQDNPFGRADYYMLNSGKADASSSQDKAPQVLLAHYPMIFHEDPRSVMVLGLASGMTAGETLHYPIDRLDVLEISREVIAGSRFFDEFNNRVRSDPRTNIIVQDGRAHLQLTDRSYDVIISEPSNPWMAGLSALFSEEFFRAAERRLEDGGIFCQWVQAYQLDWPAFAMILRTFAGVFPENVVIRGSRGDYILMGFKGRGGLDPAVAARNLAFANRSRNLSLPGVSPLFGLVQTENASRLAGAGPTHTDDRPRLEFAAQRSMFIASDPLIARMLGERMTIGATLGREMLKAKVDVDARIDFVEFALSLESPFRGMGEVPEASPSQRERLVRLYEAYCSSHAVDPSYLPDEETARRCRAARSARPRS